MAKITNKKPGAQWELIQKIFLIAVVSAVGLKILLGENTNGLFSAAESGNAKDSFAKCLNDKGVIMYGVDTCEYCQIQKKMFGSSFEKINYVNCDFDKQICAEKQITAYPVWQINDKLFPGIETLDQLANATNCVAPK